MKLLSEHTRTRTPWHTQAHTHTHTHTHTYGRPNALHGRYTNVKRQKGSRPKCYNHPIVILVFSYTKRQVLPNVVLRGIQQAKGSKCVSQQQKVDTKWTKGT